MTQAPLTREELAALEQAAQKHEGLVSDYDVLRLVRELAAARIEHEGWRPIETAPKDGRRVLVYWPHWCERAQEAFWAGPGWSADCALTAGPKDPGPTHWMPLPPPPQQDGKEEAASLAKDSDLRSGISSGGGELPDNDADRGDRIEELSQLRELITKELDDLANITPRNAPEQEGELWKGNGPCAYCSTLYGEPHYPSCDRPSVYRNAPLAASGGGEFPKLDSAGLRGAKQVAREQLGLKPSPVAPHPEQEGEKGYGNPQPPFEGSCIKVYTWNNRDGTQVRWPALPNAPQAASGGSPAAALDGMRQRYQEEYEIVDRVWKALGISTYEGANGKAIHEIVAEQKTALTAAQSEISALTKRVEELEQEIEYWRANP